MPLLMLLATALYIPALPSGSSSPRWWVLVMGSALLAGSIRGLPSVPRPVYWLFLFSAGWSSATLLWAPSLWDSAHTLLKMSVLIVLALAVQEETLERVWDWAAAGLYIVVGIQVLMDLDLLPSEPGSVQPHGGFYNKNFMGEAAAVVLVAQLFRARLSAARLAAPVALLLLSSSAAACGGALAGAVLALGFRHNWTARDWVRVAPLVAILALAVAWFGIEYLRPATWSHRLEIWSTSAGQLSIFGHGPGAYAHFFPQWENAHNDLLQLVFDYGLGVSGFIALIVLVLVKGNLHRERAVLVAVLTCGTFSFPLHNPTTAFMAAVALGSLLRSCTAVRGVQLDSRIVSFGGIPAGWFERPSSDLGEAFNRRPVISAGPQSPHRAAGLRNKHSAHSGAE